VQQGLAYNRAIIDTTKEIIGAQGDVVQYLHVLMVSSGEAVFQGAPRAVQGGQQTFPITTRRFRVVLPGGRLELAEAYR
jgi:hypothetical protein